VAKQHDADVLYDRLGHGPGPKAKVKAGEVLTEEDVSYLQRVVDWLDLHSLDEGLPEEWA
jgi:hypothetical protein